MLPGYCSITWTVVGGHGGATGEGAPGAPGGRLVVTTAAFEGDVFGLGRGADGAPGTTDPAPGGVNPIGGGGFDGQNGVGASGGGGAASVVTQGEAVALIASGGKGAEFNAGSNDGGAGGYGSNLINTTPIGTPTDTTAEPGAAGSVSGVANPCAVPNAPTGLWVTAGDRSIDLYFEEGDFDWDTMAEVTGWDASTDGGTTWQALDATGAFGSWSATVTGLTNGTTYSVTVRADSAAGPGAASAAVSAAPAAPAGAPTNVVAKAGPSSITVTWNPPASAGTYPIAGYVVGWGAGERGDLACEVDVDQPRVCVFPAEPGAEYGVTVFAVDTEGNVGTPSAVVPAGVIPAPTVPATVPASDGALGRPAGATGPVTAGKEITLTGTGYLPNSTVTVVIYSEPQVLTQVVTDATGSFTATVTVPAGLADGEHTLVGSGVDPAGNLRYLTLPVTVVGGTATATGAAVLADTGADIALPLAGGAAALLLGGGLLVASRRRATA
ncbi:exported protein of unknown function [Blastococcus saxobsidens DD2]|uniref:Fibronectin type III domain-containing protein n=1 Tax=Blastococcus saxobsidens (strain DD2) TaxID=1146883 RepID=H6RM16_BLASD|nr:exported protein of unknown function [Blastococcus saxobsidens DD2]